MGAAPQNKAEICIYCPEGEVRLSTLLGNAELPGSGVIGLTLRVPDGGTLMLDSGEACMHVQKLWVEGPVPVVVHTAYNARNYKGVSAGLRGQAIVLASVFPNLKGLYVKYVNYEVDWHGWATAAFGLREQVIWTYENIGLEAETHLFYEASTVVTGRLKAKSHQSSGASILVTGRLKDAEGKRSHATKEKRELLLIAYTEEDVQYMSYIDYFKNSEEGRSYNCEIEAFQLPSTLEEYHSKVKIYKENCTVKGLFIIAHGTENGQVVLAPDVFVDLSELELSQPGPNGSFTYGMHCYGYRHSDVERGNRVAARQLGRNLGVASSSEMPEVWRVPREDVDGQPGWVHTGLNPSAFNNAAVLANIAAARRE
eukprot:gene17778-24153_t